MLKLGVMGSTKGTDLQAIIDAIELGKIDAQINMVISNNEGAFIPVSYTHLTLPTICSV